MIESIGLRDFRGIRLGKVEGLTSLNVLIGPNNSGKTALLEAMYLGCAVGLHARVEPALLREDNKGESRLSDGRSTVLLAEPDFLCEHPMERVRHKHQHQPRPTGDVKRLPAPKHEPLQTEMLSVRTNRPRMGQFEFYPDDFGSLWPADIESVTALFCLGVSRRKYLNIDWLGDIAPENTAFHAIRFWDKPLTYRFRGDAAWYLTGKMPTAAHTFFYDAQKTLQHIPAEFYNRMLDAGVKGWPQKIAERVGRVLGIAEPFQILFVQPGPQQHEWVQGRIVPADSPSLPIDDFGDGARAAFKVLAPLIALSELVTDDEPGVFFWEEPELFQNPLTLGRLLTEVADLAQKKPLQVFLATHSMEVVAKLVDLVRTGQLPEDKLRTLRTFLHQGEFSATPFSTDDLERLSNMGFDPRVPDGDAGSPLRFRLAPDPEAPPLAEAGDE